MKKGSLKSSATTVAGTVVGAMASRVIANKLPVKNTKLKHGVLALVGVLGVAMLDRKDPTSAFTQDVAIGVTATQLGSLVKELVSPKEDTNPIITTALGSPIVDFEDPYRYDFIPTTFTEDITVVEQEPVQEITFAV